MLTRWLGIDLAGKLSDWKTRYKGDAVEFDYRNVHCEISGWGKGKFRVYAFSYCADPRATDLGTSTATFYHPSTTFLSRLEAEAHIEAEIRKATEVHPTTRFYRRRTAQLLENGRVTDDVVYFEYCLAGSWQRADKLPSFKRCSECGNETDESICPKCGGLVYS